jgi:tRNA dimethylallyltransferase
VKSGPRAEAESVVARAVVIAGPTASGKTALACALGPLLDAEVISADSQQCYRGLDAGTAKPGAAERAQVPHHLLDVAEPEEQLDAAGFCRLAEAALAGLRARGKRALVVGGTGLWIRALVRGLLEAPGADPAFRARFRERVAREGLPALYAELRRDDPDAAQAILPADRVRIERALEVFAATGERLSVLQKAHRFAARKLDVRVVLLAPPRARLFERIEARTQAFFSPAPGSPPETAPLLREARALEERIARIPAAAKALRIMGYGEAAAALAAGCTPAAIEAATRTCATRTRHYAKRQETWFRKDAPALDALSAPLVLSEDGPLRLVDGAPTAQALELLRTDLAAWYEPSPR